jgi:hypothetical protein
MAADVTLGWLVTGLAIAAVVRPARTAERVVTAEPAPEVAAV